jgi:hypothetical protein
MPQGDLALKAFSALAFFPCAIAYFNIKDDRTRYSILVSAVVSALGFLATKAIIPMIKARTLRAGLSGKDINKKGSEAGEKDIPESVGLAPGLVFLVSFVEKGCEYYRLRRNGGGGDNLNIFFNKSLINYLTFVYPNTAGLHYTIPTTSLLRRSFCHS